MKLTSALIALLFVSTTHAASPFLPIDQDNTFRSVERAIVEAAITQAEAEGKLILIDMAAAWCGPCLNLDKEMEQHKDLLAPTMAHFLYVKLEEMHIEFLSGADFMAHEIPWFPSLYVYNPANQRWTFLYATGALELKANLDAYLAHESMSGHYLSELYASIDRGDKVTLDMVMSAVLPLAVEQAGSDLLVATSRVSSSMTAKPDQFDFPISDLNLALTDAYLRAVEMGKLTFEQIRASDPNSFSDIADNVGLVHQLYFKAPIGLLIRTQGNRAASAQCEAIAAKALEVTATFPEDLQRQFTVVRAFQCLLLRVQLGEAHTAEIQAQEATLTDAERATFALSLAKNYALTGHDFEKADAHARVWKAAYEKAYAKHAELLARIQVATDQRLAAYAAGKSHP